MQVADVLLEDQCIPVGNGRTDMRQERRKNNTVLTVNSGINSLWSVISGRRFVLIFQRRLPLADFGKDSPSRLARKQPDYQPKCPDQVRRRPGSAKSSWNDLPGRLCGCERTSERIR